MSMLYHDYQNLYTVPNITQGTVYWQQKGIDEKVQEHRGKTDDWPKDVLMDLLSVTKIFHNLLVFLILNEGFMVNQHSMSVTKLSNYVQPLKR